MTEIALENYSVFVHSNQLDELFYLVKAHTKHSVVYLLTDETVWKLYENRLKDTLKGFDVRAVVIQAGESSKHIKHVESLAEQFIALGIRRDDLLLTFGGGVVGDLGGFIAATLFRGIRLGHVPTTLLAQVDSSIGSKTGVNLNSGKNLIGAFYDPVFVFIDTVFLKTLNKRELNNGRAELFKAALIYDKTLYAMLLESDTIEQTHLTRALNVKRHFVLNDKFEAGIRMHLNFGHTFGHAIERAHQYQTYKHGEAISYGMLIAIQSGIELGITDPSIYAPIKSYLKNHGLITSSLHAHDYVDSLKTDKKMRAEGLQFVVLKTIGEAMVVQIQAGDVSWMPH